MLTTLGAIIWFPFLFPFNVILEIVDYICYLMIKVDEKNGGETPSWMIPFDIIMFPLSWVCIQVEDFLLWLDPPMFSKTSLGEALDLPRWL